MFMKKIKKVLKSVWGLIKKHYFISISFGLFGLVFILLSPLLHTSWLAYPESLKDKIALKKFVSFFKAVGYCREDCAAARSFYAEIIAKALNSDSNYYLTVEKEIINPDTLDEARLALLKLCRTNNSPVSVDIKSFYADSKNDFMIRAELAKTWPEISSISLVSEIIGRYKNSSSVTEKLALLDLLNRRSDELVISLLWGVISGNDGNDLKQKAFSLLSNVERKDLVYKITDLDNLQAILDDNSYPARLKDLAIWLLNDYYPYFSGPSENILFKIAGSERFDNYQKTFAINILNHQKPANLKLPELSLADWNSYYNN